VRLSQKERRQVCNTEILDQERLYGTSFQKGEDQRGWDVGIQLATKIMLNFQNFSESDIPILQRMLASQKFHLDAQNFIEMEKANESDIDLFI
jgi:hypothetical protein